MRIFAPYSDGVELAKYAGKDIWIRCLDTNYGNTGYLRVLNSLGGNTYSVNWATDDYLDKTSFLLSSYTRNLNSFDIIEPLTTATTKELCPSYQFDPNQFDRFVGKDVWIKVISSQGYEWYIQIIDYNYPLLTLKYVASERIDGTWAALDEPDELERILNRLDEVDTWNADSLELVTPIDILTTEELVGILTDNYAYTEDT